MSCLKIRFRQWSRLITVFEFTKVMIMPMFNAPQPGEMSLLCQVKASFQNDLRLVTNSSDQ